MPFISDFVSVVGAPLLRADRASSTNDLLVDLLRDPRVPTPPLTTLVADAQLAGRGRLGRSWVSLPGRSLTASTAVLLPGTPGLRGAVAWALLSAALSMREAVAARLDATPHRVGVKWPNDVVVDGARKLVGILGEVVDQDDAGMRLVLGVGANVAMTDAERPTPVATALSLEGDAQAARDPRAVADRLLDAYLLGLRLRVEALVAHDGDARAAGLLDELAAHCVTLGRPVLLRSPSDPGSAPPATGTARSLLPDGSLSVELPDGSLRTVTAGDVEMVSSP